MNLDFIEIYNSNNYDRQLRKNEERLNEIYPENAVSTNPLPIYIISAHGSCDQGIDIYAKETEINLTHSNNIFDDTEYGNSMFNPPEDCYALHNTLLGASCNVSLHDNYILKSLTGGRTTRSNMMTEPNYVTFARQIFSNGDCNIDNWCNLKRDEILLQSSIKTYDNMIEDIITELCKNVKLYKLRRKGKGIDKKRLIKKYKFSELIQVEKILKENEKKKIKKYIGRGKSFLRNVKKHVPCIKYDDCINAFNHIEDEVEKLNKKFTKVSKNKLPIGMPGITTIEKYFEFIDEKSSIKYSWQMGVIEISNKTIQYINEHSDIKLTEKIERIPNNTKTAQKNRILNNIYKNNILTGNCSNSKKSKTDWLLERINHTIDFPSSAKKLTLSEIMYHFGRGIYICLSCTPLNILSGDESIPRFSNRLNPHYSLCPSYEKKERFVKNKIKLWLDDYMKIELKKIRINYGIEIDDYDDCEYPIIYENEIYEKLFNNLVNYNEHLYNYWPKNIKTLANSTKLPRFCQTNSPEHYPYH